MEKMTSQFCKVFHEAAATSFRSTVRSPMMKLMHLLTFLFVVMPLWRFSADTHSTLTRLLACALLGATVVAVFFMLYFVLAMLVRISGRIAAEMAL
jgi:hypothetical protein